MCPARWCWSLNNEIRDFLDAITGSWVPKVAFGIFAFGVIFTVAIALTQNVYSWLDVTSPEGIASIDVWKLGMVTGTVGTATAFLVTLYVTAVNRERSRENIPHLSMKLKLERSPTSQKYDFIVATLNAKNTGTGLCSIGRVEWGLSVLSEYDDEVIEEMVQSFDSASENSYETEFPWHIFKEDSLRENIEYRAW